MAWLAVLLAGCGGAGSGSLGGLVTDSHGRGLPGVEVSTEPSTGFAVSSSDGAWKLDSVPAGTYRITAAKAGYVTATRNGVVVNARASVLVDFSLAPRVLVGKVGGRVTDARTSAPLAGATVATTPDGGQGTTAADGTYLLADLPVGQYRVQASAAGYASALSPSVTVSADATTTVDLGLTPAVVYDSTCAECHLQSDKLLADLAADPLPPDPASENTGEG